MKTIGLLGGMSWESTVTYYQIINEAVREKLGGLHSATRFTMEEDFFRGRLARQFKLDTLVPDLAGRNEVHRILAGRFRITGIPTLLLFKDGRLVREFVGLQSAPALIAALEANT